MRDTDRHGAWSNNDQCYEDGTESHICGKRCEAVEIHEVESTQGVPLVSIIVNDNPEPQWYQN